jgi:hypothetical protein
MEQNSQDTSNALCAGTTEGFCSVTDHAEAAALLLEAVIAKLRAGFTPEDLGREVALIGRMMERKT